ncbi:phosphate/phosphite/phosphonate ABC transporters, periplasmic binding protein [Mycoplasmopsis californica]|uniref:PhnD/SsuA/transferrin family substrate-binding protein n=1 Tax=Mycoplasmopsis equigenitalium TaxID=114883 RepID=A0ABY5J2A2_9BACT|nr:PhnD/SsuA/transferrin family substrate-binding protein [Mycoplasmopsis equigenitalium]UUD36903.1 PhnD/SsuA/transferrin family substrate-binding protein [Mycoplasmopsis equigenitalium]VEU69802.1 phosphate/phosphite/phosphonate ABC transporters, periplasmic binding protein [Mycoplasmopsis californica]
MNKKLILTGAALVSSAALPVAAISCGTQDSSDAVALKMNGYSDAMNKVAAGDITLAGVWGDARYMAGENAKDLIAIGATRTIANDGVQARSNLKKGDLEAIQEILIEAIKNSKEKDANGAYKYPDLTYTDKDGKAQPIFKIYSHDAYSKVGENSKIFYSSKGENKPAFSVKPEEGNEYFEKAGTKYQMKAGAAEFKIQFIPSNDPALVQQATANLQKYLNGIGFTNIKVTVSADYNAAANALKNKSIDVAFLPVNAWAKEAGDASFILVAGRGVQIIDPYKAVDNTAEAQFEDEQILIDAHNNYLEFNKAAGKGALYINDDPSKNPAAVATGYPEDLKKHVDKLANEASMPTTGFYRSYIIARKDSEIAKLVLKALKEQGTNWKLPWADVKHLVKYGYTSTTSSASYNYVEEWMQRHFEGFANLASLIK